MALPRSARALVVVAAVAGIGATSAAAGWIVTDRLERDNDFCNACHLEPTVPLHAEIRRDFDAAPPASLSGVHARAEGGFRCIDCHGGTSPLGRARVKVLAAKDAFWYAVGHFEEPTGMRWPLWDEDCLQCHPTFAESEPEPWESPRFHQLAVHNAELGVDCVECHRVHDPGGAPDAFFLHATSVRAQCARCHPEFEEGSS